LKLSDSSSESVTAIKQSILSDAKAEARRILKEAEKAAAKIEADGKASAQAQLAGWADRQRQFARGRGDRLLGKARSDSHMRILDAKAALISEAFSKAHQRFEKERSKSQYKTFLKGLIIAAGEQIGGGTLVILSRKDDYPIITSISGIPAAITKLTGAKTKITIDKKGITCIGGVIVQNDEGNITVDYQLTTLLNQIERQYRTAIAQTLFAEKGK
jgi:vacuolar-type H+-ATPase subunit E/Vma4